MDEIDLQVQFLNGEGVTLSCVPVTTLGHEVLRILLEQLPSKAGAKLALHHAESEFMLHKTLQQQGILGKMATLSCTFVPTNVHASWRFLHGFDTDAADLALEGITELQSHPGAYLQSLPQCLQTLTLVSEPNKQLERISFPCKLQTLTLGGLFNQSLAGMVLPEGLQSLTLGDYFDQSLEGVTFPAGLQILKFGRDFNQNLEGVVLPKDLHSLTFGWHFNQSLQGVDLPEGLQSLTLGPESTEHGGRVPLPATLHSLTAGGNFKQSLEKVTWPKGLQSLTLGGWFNQSLNRAVLPCELRSLTFGDDFDQSLEAVTFPESLENLKFGRDFNQGLERVTLPQGLRNLTRDLAQQTSIIDLQLEFQLKDLVFPDSLESLTFGTAFNHSLEGVILPENLQSLTFGNRFNHSMEHVLSPQGLRSLTFGKQFRQNLEQISWPSSLSELTLGSSYPLAELPQTVTLPCTIKRLVVHSDASSEILYNNLGGFGPGHLDEPMMMRFEKTCAIDDQRVDLVLSAPHGYHPQRPALNGVHNGNAAVSVASGSSVDLRLLLTTTSGHQATPWPPMMLSKLYVSIFDQEDGRLSGLGKVAVRGFEAVIFANGTRVPSWTLPNTEQHGAWVVPVGPKVIFLFRYVTKLVITLAAPEGGHTFYISLHTPDAEAYTESKTHQHRRFYQKHPRMIPRSAHKACAMLGRFPATPASLPSLRARDLRDLHGESGAACSLRGLQKGRLCTAVPLAVTAGFLKRCRAYRRVCSSLAAQGGAVDHYALLGLRRYTTDAAEIHAASRAARHVAQELKSSPAVLARLEEAIKVLENEEQREHYDAALRGSTVEPAEPAPSECLAAPKGQLAAEANVVPGSQRVYVKTFGCQHNQSDGEYMMGQLAQHGYSLVDSLDDAEICVVNSCTVKNPAESRGLHLVNEATRQQKQVVLAGCVPSGDRSLPKKLPHVSMLHVTQLDRIVDVVEEASRGRVCTLLEKKKEGKSSALPSLSLPKVRQDRLTEIITINAGCLNLCTYCKTRMARGTVKSYSVEEIVARAKEAAAEGVCHIELASEDMGAYGVDIGSNIGELLLRLSDALPPQVMLRTGMTNPPYIMQHLDSVIEALQRPNVYSFMHVPVQSGSNAVLTHMKRKYTVEEFQHLVDRLRDAIPDIYLLTDVICGYPTETEEDWQMTLELVKRCNFHGVYSSRFFARAGTPAARLPQLPHAVTKRRYQELCALDACSDRHLALLGRRERVWFAGSDVTRRQTLGRTKNFAKVVVPQDDSLLGQSALVEIEKTCVQHVEGRVVTEA
eukprot:s1020_g3.t1